MNGVSIQYEVSNDLLLDHLHRLEGYTLDGVKVEIGEYMVGQIQDRFDHQKLWDGSAMPQSQAAKDRGGQTLIDHRLLYRSYVYNPTADGVEIGSSSPYARIHHFGGETGHPNGRFIMTARQVLGINPDDERAIGDIIINDLRGLS